MTAPSGGDARQPLRCGVVGAFAWLVLGLTLAQSAAQATEGPLPPPGAPAHPAALKKELVRARAALGPGYVPRTRNRLPSGEPLYTNRLLLESSPYLRQHAHNPVDWHPWGDAAFEKARALGRPVLVSIGYSTCHWCHVMEEESFDDPVLARVLNEHFVAIKVDRETRPDVDAVYMSAIHAMSGNGGWPLNVFVTPDREPFYAGTYFPPQARGGRPGFEEVLREIARRFREENSEIERLASRITAALQQLEGARAEATRVATEDALILAARAYKSRADREWGGVGSRTKFPSSLPVRFLLAYHRRSGDSEARAIATLALEKMAAGGIHDHVAGGFHRYATERRWLVPHFEKMLYDNALLAQAYLEAGQALGRSDFSGVARRTLDYVAREMTAPGGGFYSATDADSPGPHGESEEGLFFTWTPAELEAALGEGDARVAAAWYGVTQAGDYEGRNILHTWGSEAEVAAELGLSPEALAQRVEKIRRVLLDVRSRRAPPLRDDKILAGWNGLMISGFAKGGSLLDEPRHTESAGRAAAFVLEHMRSDDGRLTRVFIDGRASGPAFLEDYAFLIQGLLDLYEAHPSPRWLREALALQAVLDADFSDVSATEGDPEGGGYFKTAVNAERLIVREKPSRDGAVPSGNSVAARNLLRLAGYTGDDAYLAKASLLFSAFYETLARQPTSLSEMLLALDHQLDTPKEVIIVRPEGGSAEALLSALREVYLPNRTLSVVTEGDDLAAHEVYVPLLRGKKTRSGRATAYVCENRVCAYPTADPAEFRAQLSRVAPIATQPSSRPHPRLARPR